MPRTVTARSGETPDMLAFRLWGSEILFHLLLEANPVYIGTLAFSGGEVLAVPDLPDNQTEEAAPPWLS